MTKNRKTTFNYALLTVVLSSAANAQVIYNTPGETVTEDFNSGLPSVAQSLTWTDNSVFTGWYAYQDETSSAPPLYRKTFGNAGTPELYQWRNGETATDGSFGTKPDGNSGSMRIGVRLTNSTGVTLTSVNIAYTGQQWYESSQAQLNQLIVAYQVGDPANLADGTWTPIPELQFNSPHFSGNAESLNGNNAENSEVFAPVTIALSGWEDGTDLWIRWFDANSTGVDQGLAIDDFSFSAVPEPTQSITWLGIIAGAATILLRRRRN